MTEYKEKYEEVKKINEELQNKCDAYEEELTKKKNFKFEKKLSSLEIEELDRLVIDLGLPKELLMNRGKAFKDFHKSLVSKTYDNLQASNKNHNGESKGVPSEGFMDHDYRFLIYGIATKMGDADELLMRNWSTEDFFAHAKKYGYFDRYHIDSTSGNGRNWLCVRDTHYDERFKEMPIKLPVLDYERNLVYQHIFSWRWNNGYAGLSYKARVNRKLQQIARAEAENLQDQNLRVNAILDAIKETENDFKTLRNVPEFNANPRLMAILENTNITAEAVKRVTQDLEES